MLNEMIEAMLRSEMTPRTMHLQHHEDQHHHRHHCHHRHDHGCTPVEGLGGFLPTESQ